MNVLFIIVFIIVYEIFATIGSVIMSILPNWVVVTMCEVAIGFCASTLTNKIFSKRKISIIALFVCLAYSIIGLIFNIYNNGFNISLLWYNSICCVSVGIGFFSIERLD